MADDTAWAPRPSPAAPASSGAAGERASGTEPRQDGPRPRSASHASPEEAAAPREGATQNSKRARRRRRGKARAQASGSAQAPGSAQASGSAPGSEAAEPQPAPTPEADPARPRRRRRRGRRGKGGGDDQPAQQAAAEAEAAARTEQPRAPARKSEGGGRGPRRRPVYAAIDLGTNNCRLLAARADGEGFKVVDAFSRVVRLGEQLSETGRLSDAAMDRAIAALKVCAFRLRRNRVSHFRAVATEACRRAENHPDFVARVKRDTGLEIEIIAAEEEARLAVAGCAPLFDPAAEHLLVFDIGGGSTELIWVDLASTSPEKRVAVLKALALGQGSARARDAARHVNDWISLPVGVVTLIESYSGHDDDREQFDAMHAHVAELIRPFAERAGCAPTAERLEKLQVLGTSGTITTLAGVHLELQRYSRDRVDGVWIGGAEVDEVISRLREMTPYERAAVPCIGDDRATNLMSGAAILRAILRAWPTDRLRVADRGLREGLLYGLMQDAQRRAPRGAGR